MRTGSETLLMYSEIGIGGVVEILRARYGCCRGDRICVVGESLKLWKLHGGSTIPKEHAGNGWKWVLKAEEDAKALKEEVHKILHAAAQAALARCCQDPGFANQEVVVAGLLQSPKNCNVTVACVGGYLGYVIDGALSNNFLAAFDESRLALPLDKSKKKTDAFRRFFHDDQYVLRKEIEHVLAQSLPPCSDGTPHVLPWMRFLEYHTVEGALPPHTDALVRCKDTGRWSTHTLILFGSDCPRGGETVMLPPTAAGSIARSSHVCRCGADTGSDGFAVRPVRGRIFCFPHQCLHEGRPTVVVPKILLRAEVVWTNKLCGR